jgi:hypothetical protein
MEIYLRQFPEIDRQRYVEGKNEQNNKIDYFLCGLRRYGDLGQSVRFGMPGGRILPYEGKLFSRFHPGDFKYGDQVSRGRQQGKACRPHEERDSYAAYGNLKVQVLERSFEFNMLKITFPDGKDPYWVKDGPLKQINCN